VTQPENGPAGPATLHSPSSGRLQFKLEATSPGTRARATTFKTLHSTVQTPVFMPVGTHATVRSQTVDTLTAAGSQVLLANTYHLLLRPGPEVFEKMGGIHKFMDWKGSVLTDSGGYQIFSLPRSRRMTEDGAEFQSYVDGDRILLSPEISIQTQRSIGSDIMMVLDQCVPGTSDRQVALDALNLTHRWAKRSLAARGDSPQSMFAIVQGACFEDLRKQSADQLTQLPFDGFAIGGLAVGETKSEREDMTAVAADLLPKDLPRYLMGVGTPLDILEAVHRGVDMFDCIIPTAYGQRGTIFTSEGQKQIRRGVYKFEDQALDPACLCPTCARYSRAYLHHLMKVEEFLGWHLLAQHNIYFYHQMMREIRQSILDGKFIELYHRKRAELDRTDTEASPIPKPPKNRLIRGAHEIRVSQDETGASYGSILHRASGEIMHSVTAPEVEARRLYVEQSGLVERLTDADAPELVLWDVGLGAAANAMSALRAVQKARAEGRAPRAVRIVSFEYDLEPLELARLNIQLFPYLGHAAPASILETGKWEAEGIRWELLKGDFLETMDRAPAPDLIYFDPFSPKTDAKLWQLDAFKRILSACGDKATELYTYSNSTAVRAALLLAGFFVAPGVATGPKADTTIALARVPAAPGSTRTERPVRALLGAEWLARWERSTAPLPAELLAHVSAEDWRERVRKHPQFAT
jgi:queuine tRNA-ribosyltransferase